jgi:outer membrane receptor protein involved in Fe transport
VGGPIIIDRLHYFVDWEHKGFNLPNTVTLPGNLAGISNLATLLPAGVFSQFGPTTNPFTENLYFGKLDFEPSDADRFELSVKLRKETQVQGGSGNTSASAAFNFKNDDTRGVLKWQHNGDHWQNEALLTYEKTVDNPTPLSSAPAITYTWVGAPLAGGNPSQDIINVNGQDPRQYTDKHQQGKGFQDDFTLHDLHWRGDHTLKMGVKYKAVDLVARDGSDAAKFWYAVNTAGTQATPYQVVYGKVNGGLPLAATSSNKQFGVYFQDDWAVNEHLTFNLGLRWDYEISPSFTDYKTLPSILAALNGLYPDPGVNSNPTLQLPRPTAGETYAQALALGGTNINNYISTGNNRNPQSNEWQPRLGFSYDIGADEKHVVFGGFGRSYDRNLFDRLQLENSKNALSEPTINFPGGGFSNNGNCLNAGQINGTDCVAWNPGYLTNPGLLQTLGGGVGEVDMFPNKLKAPYSDQFSVGMRNKMGDWNTSATLVHLRSYDGLMGVLGNRFANGQFATKACGLDWGGSPAQWCSSGAPGIGSLILWENGQNTRTTQILLSAEKPYTHESGWAASIAYTFTDAQQNRLYNDGYAFDLPHLSNYPYTTSNAVAKQRLVVTGNIDGPWGLVFGGKLTLATPIPVTAIAGCPVNGTSCNPYGTNAWPVAVGFDQSIGFRSLDLQVTKNFEISHGVTLYGRLDLLNAFNAKNYDSNSAIWNASTTNSTPAKYNTTGPIVGVPQTLKLNFGVRW